MTNTILWTCPYCDRGATLRPGDYKEARNTLTAENADGYHRLDSIFIVCPNPRCRRMSLRAVLHKIDWDGSEWVVKEPIKYWSLVPPSKAKVFPDYVPKAICDDYTEACLICQLSPKASATLARGSLQAIIRDFWNVKAGRLVDEIEQIKDKTDPLTWDAIDSVRKMGNIGAHMEKDVDLIIEVEPNEAELLIGLIETLVQEWYIAAEERKKRLSEIKKIADEKETARKSKSRNGIDTGSKDSS